MNNSNYLQYYERLLSVGLNRGVSGWLRRRLDRRAQKCGQTGRHALFLPRVFELLNISLKSHRTVLDIGSGNGWAISYQDKQVRYIAVDNSAFYRDDLEARGIEFYEADVGSMPLPVGESSIDLIILNHLIEHIYECEFLIQQLQRVLRPGGMVYIRTPNLKRVRWKFWDDYTHVRPFTPHGLDHLMHANGFKKLFILNSDHRRISLDILTKGRLRKLLFNIFFGGSEIEAGYFLRKNLD